MPNRFKKLATSILFAGGLLLWTTPTANAHPTDELIQQIFVTPVGNNLSLEVALTPGVLISPQFAEYVDSDSDGQVSQREIQALSNAFLSSLEVGINGRNVVPTYVSSKDFELPLLAAGGTSFVIYYQVPAKLGDRVIVKDKFLPGFKTQVQQAVGIGPSGIGGAEISHSSDGKMMTFLLSSKSEPQPGFKFTDLSGKQMVEALSKPINSPIAFLLLLLICAGLGAVHALTPGHGKTLMAAYLIGDNARTRQAITLGLVVTVTHTASVIIFGLLTLFATNFLVPGTLLPILELLSGLLILILGASLLRRRILEARQAQAVRMANDRNHAHAHIHGLPHDHDAEEVLHSLERKPASMRVLLTMGVSGGIIPCPEALVVLLLAVSVNRTGLGLAMIGAFSFGLAMILVGIGLLLVSPRISRGFRNLPNGGRLSAVLPVISASIVTLIGFWLIIRVII